MVLDIRHVYRLSHGLDIVLWQTEKLPQPHFLQLVLLRGADVEQRRHDVSECSEEGRLKRKVEKDRCDADTLEEHCFEIFKAC